MGQNIYCYGNVIFADKSKKRIMKYIGAHVSASGGVEFAPVNAHEIGANALPSSQKINASGSVSL